MTRKLFIMMLLAAFILACGETQQTAEESAPEAPSQEELALNKENPVGKYGATLADEAILSISDVLANAPNNVGESVLVKGTVTDVCPKRGCWIEVSDASGDQIRVKVNDGEIVFPISAKDHPVTVQGTVDKVELDHKQAINWMAHLAEEKGEAFDSSSVTGPMTIWRLKGQGAEIF